MNTIDLIKRNFQQQQSRNGSSPLTTIEQRAFTAFDTMGIPTVKHEEWKYTRISSLFNKEYAINGEDQQPSVSAADVNNFRLPASETANELIFVNGIFSETLSTIRSQSLVLQKLSEAAKNENKDIVAQNLGHSSNYLKDGIHALNTAFIENGIFLQVRNGKVLEHPVYIYHVTDARQRNILAQPRILIHMGRQAEADFVETYVTLGASESFTNAVTEVVVEQDAIVEYYKLQNDTPQSSQVNTTHFRQVGKSKVHTVTISLNGGIVRNNLNMVMEAEHCESDLHGLYFISNNSHVDNHTVVDNVKPNCLSNELYKGIVDGQSTAVFNGKIFVRQDAQKTNAFQSNKNILLSDNATVNTKPQLEIFADDVKCSHGCTVGRLNEEGMFYLRSRGISEKAAKALLIHAFAIDVLDHIKLEAFKNYVDQLISDKLNLSVFTN